MNFKESYRREMDGIRKTTGLTERAVDLAFQMQQEEMVSSKGGQTSKRKGNWKAAAAVAAVLCILVGTIQQDMLISFAQSILGRFTISVDGERMEFGEINAVMMNVEGFLADSGTKVVDGKKAKAPYSYYQTFDTYRGMNRVTNIALPRTDLVKYQGISVELTPDYCFGHVSGELIYNAVSYRINGMYTIDGYTGENWGYGDGENSTMEKYSYGDGKNAYFVTDADGIRKVYFEEDNILFQMFLGDTNTEEQAKTLLDLFGQ